MILAYPQDFPAIALSIIMDRLRGKEIANETAVHAAWVVTGYALNNVYPDSPEQPRIVGSVVGNAALEADLIEKLLTEHQQKAITGIIPYAILAEIAMNLLVKFLMGRKS